MLTYSIQNNFCSVRCRYVVDRVDKGILERIIRQFSEKKRKWPSKSCWNGWLDKKPIKRQQISKISKKKFTVSAFKTGWLVESENSSKLSQEWTKGLCFCWLTSWLAGFERMESLHFSRGVSFCWLSGWLAAFVRIKGLNFSRGVRFSWLTGWLAAFARMES